MNNLQIITSTLGLYLPKPNVHQVKSINKCFRCTFEKDYNCQTTLNILQLDKCKDDTIYTTIVKVTLALPNRSKRII